MLDYKVLEKGRKVQKLNWFASEIIESLQYAIFDAGLRWYEDTTSSRRSNGSQITEGSPCISCLHGSSPRKHRSSE